MPEPVFAIRIGAAAIFSLADYVEQGILSPQQSALVQDAVVNKRNILITGGTGSGKTTLLNAIIQHMVAVDPTERIVIIEDTERNPVFG